MRRLEEAELQRLEELEAANKKKVSNYIQALFFSFGSYPILPFTTVSQHFISVTNQVECMLLLLCNMENALSGAGTEGHDS